MNENKPIANLFRYWEFNLRWVRGVGYKDSMWFRFGKNGMGIIIKRSPPLFSERHGYEKFLHIPFCAWRIGVLR